MFREFISTGEFIAIKNHAIRVKDVVDFDLNCERKTIKVTLRNKAKIKIKFHTQHEFITCLDSVFESIVVIDYHCPRMYFKR